MEPPRKRARNTDPTATSRQWYPWPEKIVSLHVPCILVVC